MSDPRVFLFDLWPQEILERLDRFVSSAPTDCHGWVGFLKAHHRYLPLLDKRMGFDLGSAARLKRFVLNNSFCVGCGSEELERGSDTCSTCDCETRFRKLERAVFNPEIERLDKKRKRVISEIEKLETMRDHPWLTPRSLDGWKLGSTRKRIRWDEFREKSHLEFHRLIEKRGGRCTCTRDRGL